MTNEEWYAVMMDREDNDWGYGSAVKDEAEKMVISHLPEHPEAYIAVIENDTCIYEIEPEDFGIWKRYYVHYAYGESRNIIRNGETVPVDYMLCDVEGTELYAEMENPTWNEEKGCYDDEYATFEELKSEIERQARENHFEEDWLDFGN